MQGLFTADLKDRGLVFDPRTKLFAMLTIIIFVLGGVGIHMPEWMNIGLSVLPIALLLTAGKWKKSLVYLVLLAASECLAAFGITGIHGTLRYFIVMICLLIQRVMPGLIMGAYIFSTTTVSEFVAAMHRMHITDKIVIPFSVMFRFFPTVMEEFFSINSAMRMRDIRIGSKNAGKLVEYRLVPLMVCSVRIGEELSQAALTRGLAPGRKRTNVCRIGFAVQDFILILICLIPYSYFVLRKAGISW